ncbi:hypothetical protein V5N11_022292 [Cardamine amara subsp. amara]|uniref:Uncharacterized protein n=1 Tax=Cardamine amara subsp. amara TaxID=228776 RepID=A0ABD1B7C7_CARAN
MDPVDESLKQKPTAKIVITDGVGELTLVMARFKGKSSERDGFDDGDEDISASHTDLMVEETEQPKPNKEKNSTGDLAIAAAKIDTSDLQKFFDNETNPITPSYWSPALKLFRLFDYYGTKFSGVSCPWYEMFSEYISSKQLFDMIDVPLCHIPNHVYQTTVSWLDQEVTDDAVDAFVLWAFNYIPHDVYFAHNGGWKDGKKPTDISNVAMFVVLALVLQTRPHVLIALLPTLHRRVYYRPARIPLAVWMTAQAAKGDLSLGLYTWAHYLVPQLSSSIRHNQSWDLILASVEKILLEQNNLNMFVHNPVWKGMPLFPPRSFEILLLHTFHLLPTTVEVIDRLKEIYPAMKEVALTGALKSDSQFEAIQHIFNFSLRLAGEENTILADEATEIAIFCLIKNHDCCGLWDHLFRMNLKASAVILKKLWTNGTAVSQALKRLMQKIFTFSLLSVEDADAEYTDFAEQVTAICILSLTKNVDCWKHWGTLYKKTLRSSAVLLRKFVEEWKSSAPESDEMKQVTQEMFTFSLKLAREGNPDLTEEATETAIWSLKEIVDSLKLWDNLNEEKLKACVGLLKNLVEKWNDHSLQLSSSSSRDTLASAPRSEAMKQVTKLIFTFSFTLAKEGNPVLAKEATVIAIWSLTENIDCCDCWDNLYEDNLEPSVALLKLLVDKWKVHSLRLSSDTLTLSQLMKSLMLKNKKAISEGGANASLYREADKSCKVISRKLSWGSSCLKGGTAVVVAVVIVAVSLPVVYHTTLRL